MTSTTTPVVFHCPLERSFTYRWRNVNTYKAPGVKCGTPTSFDNQRNAIEHWHVYHALETYNAPNTAYNCDVCKFGFPTLTLYLLHLQQVYGPRIVSTLQYHARNLRQDGLLWTVDGTWVVDTGTAAPTYTSLLAIHMHSVSSRKDHLIFVFRRSGGKALTQRYIDHFTDIATNAASALQSSRRADVASIAILGSYGNKGRFMPSFAADPDTEQLMIHDDIPGGRYTARGLWTLRKFSLVAAIATTCITNQIMYAKLHGRRPILVTMGLDGLSKNWSRLLQFVDRYTSQYGKLELAVRMKVSEATSERGESSLEICPTKIGPHYFGFYDSEDFALHSSGVEHNRGLAEWEDRINALQEYSFNKSKDALEVGGNRVEKMVSKSSKTRT
ncbi:hypothetical protein KCU89_g11957, partial [Aureobasidium melanogenum]